MRRIDFAQKKKRVLRHNVRIYTQPFIGFSPTPSYITSSLAEFIEVFQWFVQAPRQLF